MPGILEFMASEHEKCDEQFAAAEQQVSKKQWEQADAGFDAFHTAMERHFKMEEDVLFVHLERVMGGGVGPVAVMKMEHGQMRDLMGELAARLKARDTDGYLGAAETLLVLMQQHNMKEEQILYPMAERALASGQEQIVGEMENV